MPNGRPDSVLAHSATHRSTCGRKPFRRHRHHRNLVRSHFCGDQAPSTSFPPRMLASYLSGANDQKVGVQHSATYSPLARLPRMPSQSDTDHAQGTYLLRAKPASDWPFALDSDSVKRYRIGRFLGKLVAGVREWAGSPLGTIVAGRAARRPSAHHRRRTRAWRSVREPCCVGWSSQSHLRLNPNTEDRGNRS